MDIGALEMWYVGSKGHGVKLQGLAPLVEDGTLLAVMSVADVVPGAERQRATLDVLRARDPQVARTELEAALDEIGFDPNEQRIFRQRDRQLFFRQ